MTPEEYANEKVFPFVGITSDDYEWYKNFDEVNLGFHGIKMNVRSASKMGMLYLQGGMANENDRIIDQSWIDRSHTVGDASEEATPFGFMWWLGTGTYVCNVACWLACHTHTHTHTLFDTHVGAFPVSSQNPLFALTGSWASACA